MKTLVTQYKENVVENANYQKFGSLYIEATNGPFTNTTIVLPVAANPKTIYGDVTFTYSWTNPTHKELVVNSTGIAKIEIENYYGLYYISVNPYSTIFKFDNIAGIGIFKGFDVGHLDYVVLFQCIISGDIAMAGGQPNMKRLYIQDKSGSLYGDIVSLGDDIGLTILNFYGNSNIYGDEDALFDDLAANGKTASMTFDFRNTSVISSSGKVLNGTVVFSGGSWTIQ